MKSIILACALAASTITVVAAPAQAFAANSVSLASDVFVERQETDANGKVRVTLEEPKVVVPGDKLVFVLKYQNKGAKPAENFTITNPLPTAILFQGATDGTARVSVDGGRSWGTLDSLSVKAVDGTVRAARMADVTHVRWVFDKPIPASGAGKLMFRGIVK